MQTHMIATREGPRLRTACAKRGRIIAGWGGRFTVRRGGRFTVRRGGRAGDFEAVRREAFEHASDRCPTCVNRWARDI